MVLPSAARPRAPDAPRPEIALIGLDLAIEGALRLAGLGDVGAEQSVVAVHRVAVEPGEGRGGQRRDVRAEQPRELPELAL